MKIRQADANVLSGGRRLIGSFCVTSYGRKSLIQQRYPN